MGVIGDPINLAARLQAAAQPNEIVMSNTFYNHLDGDSQSGLIEMEPMEARNVGNIKAWRTGTPLSC
jgi:class 3 adenylate cyclase